MNFTYFQVVPVADLLDGLFNKVELYLNHTLVGYEIGNHHQLAYFRNLLNYGTEFKSALKSTIGKWFIIFVYLILHIKRLGYDEEMKDNNKVVFPDWRYKFIENSKELTLCGRLQNGFFNCSKLLIPNVPIRIRLDRNTSEYCLLTAANANEKYKLNIRSCTLFMRKVAVAPKIYAAISHKLTQEAAVYPYMRTDMRHFLIPSGTQSIKQNNVLSGRMPCRLLFAVCPTTSLSGGSYKNNPIVFSGSQYQISYVNFFVNDESVLSMPYKPDFKKKDYVMSYVGLLRAMRLLNSQKPIAPMDYDAFGETASIFGVDLTADASNLAPLGLGNVSVEVHFKNNLTESVNGVLVAEYRSCVYVDNYRNITQADL